MNISDKLAIVLYTTTKGHFGYKDCYKKTVERMESEIPLFDNYYKVAHVKLSNNDDFNLFLEMEAFLNDKGFNVIPSKGDWSHNQLSHHNEYYKDMLTALSDTKLHKYPFVFSFEDDWLINFSNKFSIAVSKAISFLEKDLNAMCVRVNHDIHTDVSEAHQELDGYIFQQGINYTEYGPTYTFQPTIVKLKEWYHSVRLINKQIERNPLFLQMIHCEIISGETLKQFSDCASPFYFFDPKIINAEHIGEEDKINKFKNKKE